MCSSHLSTFETSTCKKRSFRRVYVAGIAHEPGEWKFHFKARNKLRESVNKLARFSRRW